MNWNGQRKKLIRIYMAKLGYATKNGRGISKG